MCIRGELSTWAASRVLVPLARANNDHAQTLLTALERDPLSTRELHTWYQHYQKANHLKRERMLAQPRLFCQALQAQTRDQAASELHAGPEGAWLAELKRITQRLRRLNRQLPLVFAGLETGSLQQARVELKTLFQDLDETLARTTHHDGPEIREAILALKAKGTPVRKTRSIRPSPGSSMWRATFSWIRIAILFLSD